jgi:hypothetical protein
MLFYILGVIVIGILAILWNLLPKRPGDATDD